MFVGVIIVPNAEWEESLYWTLYAAIWNEKKDTNWTLCAATAKLKWQRNKHVVRFPFFFFAPSFAFVFLHIALCPCGKLYLYLRHHCRPYIVRVRFAGDEILTTREKKWKTNSWHSFGLLYRCMNPNRAFFHWISRCFHSNENGQCFVRVLATTAIGFFLLFFVKFYFDD